MDQLAAMRSFVAVVERGGFSSAGRSLGLSGPMVGNHVRALESWLGGRLLNRTTRARHLTELGDACLRRCRAVFAELDGAEADAAALIGMPRGVLRVTAPHSIGSVLLPPVIARFLRDHPAVSIDLRLTDRRLDLVADRFDVALRSGKLDDAGLLTRGLAPMELVACAAPDYLARRGVPTSPAELARHECLDFADSASPGVWRFDTPDGVVDIPVSGALRANSGVALRQAAVAGAGIILQPRLLVRQAIEAGLLLPLLADCPPESRPVQLLTHPDRRPPPKLRAFVDAIVDELGTQTAGRQRRPIPLPPGEGRASRPAVHLVADLPSQPDDDRSANWRILRLSRCGRLAWARGWDNHYAGCGTPRSLRRSYSAPG